MQTRTNQALIIFFSALGILLLYLLSSILTPFMLGALIAYLGNPLVKRLEKLKVPHLIAVILVFVLIFGGFILLIAILTPIVQIQAVAFLETLPDILAWIQDQFIPWMQQFINISTLKATLTGSLSKTAAPIEVIVTSGYAIVGWAVNIVLTPVVAFYLLRDWDSLCHRLSKALPKSIAPTVIQLAKQCDEVLSVFFRGQFLVMISLSFIYGIGLTLIGLKAGLIIGLVGGLLSIVPYLGATFVLVVASLSALVQFSTLHSVLLVLLVFLIGQGLEGYVLIPNLIGKRMGLHPVVVIFAIMAGGTLFGFFGILLALPAAAVIKVLLRFVNRRYLHVSTS